MESIITKKYSDIQLINNVKNNNDAGAAYDELKVRYGGMLEKFYGRYVNGLSGILRSELEDEKNYIFTKSLFEYVPEKAAFSTFLVNSIRYNCLNKINSSKDMIYHTIPITDDNYDFLVDNCPDTNTKNQLELEDKESNQSIEDILSNIKDKRIETIIKLKFFNKNKLTWKQISAETGNSVQTCISLYNKGKEILKNELTIQSLSYQ